MIVIVLWRRYAYLFVPCAKLWFYILKHHKHILPKFLSALDFQNSLNARKQIGQMPLFNMIMIGINFCTINLS